MTRVEELEWFVAVLNDLKFNYPEHDNKTLDEILSIVKYRLDKELSTIKHRNGKKGDNIN